MAIATGTALAIGGGLAAAGSAYAGSKASKAAKAQQRAAEAAAARQQALGQQIRTDLAPYREAGAGALDVYKDIVLGGDLSKFQTSPGYQFRLGQGIEGLERTAAARGGLLSGAQLKGVERFSQGLASDEYQNYLNQLYNLSQQGLGATTQTSQFGLASTQAQNLASQQAAQQYGLGQQARGQAAQGALEGIGQGFGAYAGYKAGYNPLGGV